MLARGALARCCLTMFAVRLQADCDTTTVRELLLAMERQHERGSGPFATLTTQKVSFDLQRLRDEIQRRAQPQAVNTQPDGSTLTTAQEPHPTPEHSLAVVDEVCGGASVQRVGIVLRGGGAAISVERWGVRLSAAVAQHARLLFTTKVHGLPVAYPIAALSLLLGLALARLSRRLRAWMRAGGMAQASTMAASSVRAALATGRLLLPS